jgi:hypothetical protein
MISESRTHILPLFTVVDVSVIAISFSAGKGEILGEIDGLAAFSTSLQDLATTAGNGHVVHCPDCRIATNPPSRESAWSTGFWASRD